MWAAGMKREVDRGLVGSWARRARIDAGYTSAERAAAAAHRRGVEISPAYLRGVESGAHRPSRELVAELAGLYGVSPPSEDEESDRWLAEIRTAVGQAMDARLSREEQLLARLERLLERLAERQAGSRRPPPT